MNRPIDLTHTFALPMPVYPGDPEPELLPIASIGSEGYADAQLTTGLHVGTHLDAPAHMIVGGATIDMYPLERFVGRGVLVDARGKRQIGHELLQDVDLKVGDIVLVLTGWSRFFRSSLRAERSNPTHEIATAQGPRDDNSEKYFTNFPIVTEAFADMLVEAQVSILGLDTPSPDPVTGESDDTFPIHHLLLESDVLIAENLNNLEQLAHVKEFEVIAFPLKLAANAGPARVAARLP